VGAVYFDETPLLDQSRVKPFIIAALLFRGAVSCHEVVHQLSVFCHKDDLVDEIWDTIEQDYTEMPRAEKLVLEVLGEMTGSGLLRYNERDELWVLTSSRITEVISWCAATGGRMPSHLNQSIY